MGRRAIGDVVALLQLVGLIAASFGLLYAFVSS